MKEDKRALRSKRWIKNSYLELLKESPADKITPTDICKKADINRTTFYAHYENIDALHKELVLEETDKFKTIFNKYKFDKKTDEILDATIKAFKADPYFFPLLQYEPTGSVCIEAITNIMYEKVIPVWKKNSDLSESEIRLLIKFITTGAFSVLKEWYESNFEMSDQQIKTLLEHVIKYGVYDFVYNK